MYRIALQSTCPTLAPRLVFVEVTCILPCYILHCVALKKKSRLCLQFVAEDQSFLQSVWFSASWEVSVTAPGTCASACFKNSVICSSTDRSILMLCFQNASLKEAASAVDSSSSEELKVSLGFTVLLLLVHELTHCEAFATCSSRFGVTAASLLGWCKAWLSIL